MIYISYNLTTLKNLAKQLKRQTREIIPSVSTMDCLNVVAKAHNANDWNHLHKTYKMMVNEIENNLSYRTSPSQVSFVEDLSFKARMKLLEDIVERMYGLGVPKDILGKYAEKIMSIYAPTSSRLFQKILECNGDTHTVEYTSFNDMYGNLFVASESKQKHTLFLMKEVIPECLRRGGLLMLSKEQYRACRHLLNGKMVQTIHLDDNNAITPLSWSDNATIDDVDDFYCNGFFGFGDQGMLEGRSAMFFETFFKLWRSIGKEKLPIKKVLDFSPATLEMMLKMASRTSIERRNVNIILNNLMEIDIDVSGWSSKLSEHNLDFWAQLTKVKYGIHRVLIESKNENSVHLDSMFDDLSKVTVVVCEDIETAKPFDYRGETWLKEALLSGVVSLFSSNLKKRRNVRLTRGVKMPKCVVYTSPNSVAVQRGFLNLGAENGPYLKMVNSVLVDPIKENQLLQTPDELSLRDINTPKFNDIEHETLKYQADHILNLNSIQKM